jgi:hypothetical protein
MEENSEKIPDKKRGRKKKEILKNDEVIVETEKKKRGRKKKWESFANTKLEIPESDEEPIDKPQATELATNYEKQSVAFGNLNITVHSNKDQNNTQKFKKFLDNNITNTKKNSVCKIDISNSDLEESEDEELFFKEPSKLNSTKILKEFTKFNDSGKEINRTEIYCFNCCHPFYNKPAVLPIDYNPLHKRYKVFGNFCSPNCAKRYALDDKVLSSNVHILSQMYRELYSAAYRIKPAPSKFLLKCFGGKLSIEEYRNTFTNKINYVDRPINTKMIFLEIKEI